MRNKGFSFLVFLIIVGVLGIVTYFGYKYLIPQLNSVLPNGTPIPNSSANVEAPILLEPKSGTKIVSPLKVRGTVPPGWMFEGVFPIKLMDVNGKVIAESTAKEEVLGSWQSNTLIYFTATLTFPANVKSGYLVLNNDNPSGDPVHTKTYKIRVNLNCTPRPSCLDATPRCMIPETSDMCPR